MPSIKTIATVGVIAYLVASAVQAGKLPSIFRAS